MCLQFSHPIFWPSSRSFRRVLSDIGGHSLTDGWGRGGEGKKLSTWNSCWEEAGMADWKLMKWKKGDYHFSQKATKVEITCQKWQKFWSLTDMTTEVKADRNLKVKYWIGNISRQEPTRLLTIRMCGTIRRTHCNGDLHKTDGKYYTTSCSTPLKILQK